MEDFAVKEILKKRSFYNTGYFKDETRGSYGASGLMAYFSLGIDSPC